ncbi:thermonuclease family protein [Acaryochloris sp. CCMEE 5410]|uniref:thermonuclease family protein n=1 Tax=Acaryochloris sp. CCMEE 5410 TaxID=310037 RepID=UPI00024847EA|nr:thermonuclease family protein [Acaryochloris sp. CCMEE 5410]KAI9131248.1 thermonuclease family protein [Acaryochloris sp. CCMEE 5410]
MFLGTTIEATVVRVVDGDTIRVLLPYLDQEKSLRLLNLETEESNSGSNKIITPWGQQAKERAERFFQPQDLVTLEYPGTEPAEICHRRYQDNYGRPLLLIHKQGVDYQEVMIREGYSPYFNKYGNAAFSEYHQRYQQAERDAQQANLGVWDQLAVNGEKIHNYAALGIWWGLRAEIIDGFRQYKAHQPDLLNSRLDFEEIVARAQHQEKVVVFTELRSLRRITATSARIEIGSVKQPFSLYLPNTESPGGKAVVNLLNNRYFSTENAPKRSYAYVAGQLRMFNKNPQITIKSTSQIMDEPTLSAITPLRKVNKLASA